MSASIRLHEGGINKEKFVGFLNALTAHLKQPLVIIRDGLRAHRSPLVRANVDSLNGQIQIAFVPMHSI